MSDELQEKCDENKIDLVALNKFFLDKDDGELFNLLSVNYFDDLGITINQENFNYYLQFNSSWEFDNYTYDKVKNALVDYPLSLRYLDYHLRLSEFCEIAVNNDPDALEFVPSTIENYYEVCEIAVYKDSDLIRFVQWYPLRADNKYYSLCEIAVLKKGDSLYYIPIKLRDYSLCEKAIINTSQAFFQVPTHTENYYSLVKLAYKKDKYIIRGNDIYKFPTKYIPQLIVDFPEDREFLEKYLLQENIRKQVKKLLKELLFKRKVNGFT